MPVVFKNTVAQLVTATVGWTSTLLLSILLGRFWGAESLGEYSFVIVFVGLFSFACDWGLDQLIVREIARAKDQVTRYVNNSLSLTLLFSIGVMLLISLVINWLGRSPEVRIATHLAGLWVSMGVFVLVLRGAFFAFEWMQYETIGLLVERAANVFGSVIVLVVHSGLVSLIMVLLLSRLLNVLTMVFFYRREFASPCFQIDLSFWKLLVAKTLPFGILAGLVPVYGWIDVVMLSQILGDAQVGYYRAAATLAMQVAVVAITLNYSLLPSMSRLFLDSPDLYRIRLERALVFLITIALPAAVLLYFLSDRLIIILYGAGFSLSVVCLQIYSGVMALRFVTNTFGMALNSADRQGMRTASLVIATVINIALNLYFIPSFGIVGASVTTLLGEIADLLVCYFLIRRFVFKLDAAALVWRPVCATVVLVAVVSALRDFPVPAAFIGCLAYLAVLSLIGGVPRYFLDLIEGPLHHLRRFA